MKRENMIQIATERFEMIAPLLTDGLCAAEKRKIRHDIIEKHGISERTIRRYLERYRKNGLQGLEPKERRDAGTFKAIPMDVLDVAMQCRKELPERSVRNIITILEKEDHVKQGSISQSTLSHNLLALGHSTKQLRYESGTQAARRFVREGRNTLWQSDCKYGLYVPDGNGKNRRTYLLSFIDDCTRVVTHSEFYFNHRVPVLEDCFRKALLKFGKPDSVYVDNGKEFTSKWMRIGCARLGIRHIRTAPYSAQSKGKIERFQGFAEEFIREAGLMKFESLAHLNKVYRAWLEEGYQHKEHESLAKSTPMHAFQRNEKRIRFTTPEECYDAFLHEVTRTTDKTGCFSLGGIIFDAGFNLARRKIDIRYDPFDLTVVEVWHAGTKQFDAKPLVISEFTDNDVKTSKKTTTEIGRSRLLDIYVKDNEKRLKNAVGILTFGSHEGGAGSV